MILVTINRIEDRGRGSHDRHGQRQQNSLSRPRPPVDERPKGFTGKAREMFGKREDLWTLSERIKGIIQKDSWEGEEDPEDRTWRV